MFYFLCIYIYVYLYIYLYIYIYVYSVIWWLYISVLFSLHLLEILEHFSFLFFLSFFLFFFFLQSTANLTAPWSEKILGMISFFFLFLFTKARFMAQDVIYHGVLRVQKDKDIEIHIICRKIHAEIFTFKI